MSLILRDLYKAYGPSPFPLEKPRVIQFPVNDICNARCQMCHIWEQKLDTQITPEQLLDALDNPLYSKVRAVGLNGGEPTLRRDLPELADALYRRLPGLKTISLITNGLVAKRVCESVDALGEVVLKHNGWLDVMISADGVGEVHDKVRGRDGNFSNVETVLEHVKHSPMVNSHQLACTIIRDNVYGLHDVLDWAIMQESYIKFRLAVPHGRLYTEGVTEPFSLDRRETLHVALFLESLIKDYEQIPGQRFFYRSLVDQLVYKKPRQAGCNWKHRGVTLTARGELAYCAVESKILGSAITEDSEAVYFRESEHLDEIIANKCDNCRHDYGGLPPGPEYLQQCLSEASMRLGLDTFIRKQNFIGLPTVDFLRSFRIRRELRKRDLNRPDPQPAQTLPARESGAMLRVIVCGWYGTETLGDQAILASVIDAIEQAAGPCEFFIASLEPYISEKSRAEVPALSGARILDLDQSRQELPKIDMLVFGGGPLMAINAMTDMLDLFRRAAALSIPTMIAGCGVGPLGHRIHNQSITRLLKLASIRVFRDEASREQARRLGVMVDNDLVAEDPACSWFRQNRPLAVSGSGDTGKTLLLALRDWPVEQYARSTGLQARQAKSVFDRNFIALLRRFIELSPEARIVPFAMCSNHHGGDDRWFYRRILREAPDLAPSFDSHYLTHAVTLPEAPGVFSSATAVLSMRFHSLLLASEMGRPVLALDYTLGQGKVHHAAKSLGVECERLDQLDVAAVAATLSTWIENEPSNREYPRQGSFPEAVKQSLGRLRES